MGSCGNHHENHCGKFETPQNPDDGLAWPYRQKLSCSAPDLPVPECEEEEITTDYDPDDITSPFTIFARLFDQSCLPILDQNGAYILTQIS